MTNLSLPTTWAEGQLKDVANINMGQSPLGADVTKNQNGLPLIGGAANLKPTGIVSDQYVLNPTKRCNIGDIILCIRATIGRYSLADKVYCIGRGVAAITPANIEPLFLCKLLENQQQYLNENATGSTFRQVDKATIQSMPVPIPPLGEQKRIVSKIESTQEKIKAIEQSVTKAEELIGKYREALLQKAFRGELVPQDPNDEPASKLLERIRADSAKQTAGKKKKKDDLPPIKPEEIPFEIPKSWEWVRLTEIIEIMTDFVANGSFESLRNNVTVKDAPDHALYVRLTDLRRGLGHEGQKYVDKDSFEFLRKSALTGGEILIANVGANFGESMIMPKTDNLATIAPNMILVRLNSTLSSNVFVQSFLSSPIGRMFFNALVTSTAQPKFNKTDFKQMLVPLPPFKEQIRIERAIAEHVSNVANVEEQIVEVVKRVAILSESVLSHAFSGNLVQQDPSEGTGHELLEKIRQSNQAEPRTTKDKVKKKPRTK